MSDIEIEQQNIGISSLDHVNDVASDSHLSDTFEVSLTGQNSFNALGLRPIDWRENLRI